MKLRRYWFQFEDVAYKREALGCGVTAFSYEDAVYILKRTIFEEGPVPPIAKVVADVDVRTLEQGHVVGSMNPPNLRGLWFPRGFDFNR